MEKVKRVLKKKVYDLSYLKKSKNEINDFYL